MGRLEELENDVRSLILQVVGLQGRNKELYAILSDMQEFKDTVEARLKELEDEKSVRVEGNQYFASRLRTIEQTLRIMEDRMLELEQKKKANDYYPDHWPRKADGLGVEVGDDIYFNNGEYREVEQIDYTQETIKTVDCDIWWCFSYPHWSEGFQFRFPTEEDIKEKVDNACTGIGDNHNAKFVDCGRALELIDKIEHQIPREVFAWRFLGLDFKELRQLLGGSDE